MMKTCEEYVLNRLEQLEESYQQLVSTNAGLVCRINEYRDQIEDIKKLLNISVEKSNLYGNKYLIDADILYDVDDKDEFDRVCYILGLKIVDK